MTEPVHNPIKVACPNKQCGAPAGAACKTVGKFINATPHMPRLRVLAGHLSSQATLAAMRDRYTESVLEKLIRRRPTPEEIARAQREGSLKPDKGWLRDLIADYAAPRRALPKIRKDANGTTTYWGSVVEERQLESGEYVLELHTGYVIRLRVDEAWRWDLWWPERKAEAAYLGHARPRYRIEVAKNGQVTSIAHEEPVDDSELATPSKRVDAQQIGLGL